MLHYMKNHIPLSVTELVMYSDGCGGQQKNHYFSAMCLYAVETTGIQSIRHVFMEKGHSQSEVDQVHARLEKRMKRIPISDEDEWVREAENSKQTQPKYEVEHIKHSDILNFKDYGKERLPQKLVDSNTDNPIAWTDVHIIEYRKTEPGKIFIKTDESTNTFEVTAQKKRSRRSQHVVHPAPKYPNRLPISQKKRNDLMRLCKKGLIHPKYHKF